VPDLDALEVGKHPVTNVVYKRSPYSEHATTPDTPNPSGSIVRNGGSKGILTLKKSWPGYVGTIGTGVHLT
jgi:hypothetical protein